VAKTQPQLGDAMSLRLKPSLSLTLLRRHHDRLNKPKM